MKNHISVFITKEDFETRNYYDNHHCPLATALRRLGYNDLEIRGIDASIGLDEYAILEGFEVAEYSDRPQDLMVNLLKI